jgi:plastocyanin
MKNMDRHIVRPRHAAASLFTTGAVAGLAAGLVAGTALGAEITVTQQGVTFVPQTVRAYPGDVIRWVYTGGTHTVTSGADCTPDGLFNAELTVKSTEFSWTVPASAAGTTVPYFCEPHCIFFQTGSIEVGREHVVTQQSLTFVPANITVSPGDRIRWVRTAGNHTVTSGAGCAADGLFDGPLTLASPEFSWVVPASAAGQTIPYYCAPHCFFSMVGTITVQGAANPADIDGDGAVNAADLATLLNSWGAKGGAADIDRNGSVDAADLAVLLGAWTG